MGGCSVDIFVNNRFKWPQEFILSGQNKNWVSYNQLLPIQWMAGFCRIIREEANVHTKENMLDYVINLLEDAQDFSSSSAKAWHAVLLCRMKQREVKGWNENDKINRYVVLTVSDTTRFPTVTGGIQTKLLMQKGSTVCISIKVLHKSSPMKQKVCSTSTYVHIVGLKMVKPIHIHRGIAGNSSQKINKRVKGSTTQIGGVHNARFVVNVNMDCK